MKIFLHIFLLFILHVPLFNQGMENENNPTHEILKPLFENIQITEEISKNLPLWQVLNFRFVSHFTDAGALNYLQRNAYEIFARQMQTPFYFNDEACENKILDQLFNAVRKQFWLHDANPLITYDSVNIVQNVKYNLQHHGRRQYYTIQNNTNDLINNKNHKVFFYETILRFCLDTYSFNTKKENSLFFILSDKYNYFHIDGVNRILQESSEIALNTFIVVYKQDIEPLPLLVYIFLQLCKQEYFSYILDKIDLQYKDSCSRNLIHYAIIYGNTFLFKNIIRLGLSPFDRDYKGRTALHYAVLHGQERFFLQLIELGLSFDDRDYQGNSPFLLAIMNCKWPMLEKILTKKYPVNISLKNNQNKNALNILRVYEKRMKYDQTKIRGRVAEKRKKKFYAIVNMIHDLSE